MAKWIVCSQTNRVSTPWALVLRIRLAGVASRDSVDRRRRPGSAAPGGHAVPVERLGDLKQRLATSPESLDPGHDSRVSGEGPPHNGPARDRLQGMEVRHLRRDGMIVATVPVLFLGLWVTNDICECLETALRISAIVTDETEWNIRHTVQ